MAIEKIELTVGGTALAFAPTATDYNNMINSMQPDNKVAPAQQFLMRTVLPAHADA
ncbi:hypothetical protein I7V27_22810, partial [Lelliottia amnigena]|nr:hypothetical protein [Lelliottia amnigena]MBL5937248.1 hypothetical protein [Lelliottia amnigena]